MGDNVKKLAILGSTGSIGQQTLDVVRVFSDRFKVIALAAGQNQELLSQQITEFKPQFVYLQDILATFPDTQIQRISMEEIACHPDVDIVVMATSGKAGLSPTLAAVKAGKKVALANKESLVTAGAIITREAEKSGTRILPVDSEHSAIWQCLNGEKEGVSRLILTASGGPFRSYTREQLESVTVEQALAHPSWNMGKKVTIDSATLINKGLEVIEAHWLFGIPYENIDVLIHPQSIIHSMVEFTDGSAKAQLSHPDMRLPIQYALTYPERLPNPQLPRLDWQQIKNLYFEQPNPDLFPCLKLAIEAGKQGGTYPAVLCAADEIAVDLFLSRQIKFIDIAKVIKELLEQHKPVKEPDLDEIQAADDWARQKVRQMVNGDIKC